MTDWTTPTDFDRVEVAFGANALDHMPPREECEAALKEMKDRGREWRELQSRWFFAGLPADTEFKPKDGIDTAVGRRVHLDHIAAVEFLGAESRQGSLSDSARPREQKRMRCAAFQLGYE